MYASLKGHRFYHDFGVYFDCMSIEMCICFWADDWRVPSSRVPLASISVGLSVVMYGGALNDVFVYGDILLIPTKVGKRFDIFLPNIL